MGKGPRKSARIAAAALNAAWNKDHSAHTTFLGRWEKDSSILGGWRYVEENAPDGTRGGALRCACGYAFADRRAWERHRNYYSNHRRKGHAGMVSDKQLIDAVNGRAYVHDDERKAQLLAEALRRGVDPTAVRRSLLA